VLAGLHEHSSIFLKQPVHTTKLLQPMGVHASNVLASLPQLHFCMQELRWLNIYLACVCAARNFPGFSSIPVNYHSAPGSAWSKERQLYSRRHYRWRRNSGISLFPLYPDMMFGISSFNAQNTGGASTTTTASDFGGVTGNSTNGTGAP
jgi:hypothetical protein